MASAATARASEPASARRERILWSLGIFALALLVRLVVIWQLSGSALFELRMGDGRVYDLWARRIAAGDWLGDEVFYQAPLYPYFLALVQRLVGDDLLAVRLVQVTLGAGSCALLTQAGWRLFSKRAGILAGVLLAFYAPAFFADTMIQKSVFDLLFVSLVLFLIGGIDGASAPQRCLPLGAALGALVLSRENALVFVVVLLLWLLWLGPSPWRRRVARGAFLLCGVALLLLPVALRNWYVGGELHLTTSQFGHNFFIGNSAGADGTYRPLIYGRGDPLIERQDAIELAEQAAGEALTPAEVSGFYTQQALRWIRANPSAWARLMARKLALALNAVELVDTEDQYTHAESSWLLRVAGRLFDFGVLAPLALLGVWITWPQRRRLLPLYLLPLAYTATLLLFYIFGRYRLPLVPILALFAAAAVVGLRAFLRSSPRPAAAACLISVALLALFCRWPLVDQRYMRSVTHYNIGNELAAQGRIEEAKGQFRHAIELHGDNAVANHNLAALLAQEGDLAAARAHFEQALRIAPGYAQAHINLARVLNESGEPVPAIESYRRGLSIDPERADVLLELGGVLAESGRLAEAEESFERALRIEGDLTEARKSLRRVRAGREAAASDPDSIDSGDD